MPSQRGPSQWDRSLPVARARYEGEPWFDLAAQFADDWDQVAFDPEYDTLPLDHFEPLVRARCANPTSL